MAQQVNGTLGSPSATTTIDGNQLPPPPPKFGGVIKETVQGSKTWWPPRVVPPKGAPNVLLIMTDDQGYGVSGTYGGVIPMLSRRRHWIEPRMTDMVLTRWFGVTVGLCCL